VPCGPINRIDQVFADPQVRHLAMARPVQHKSLGEIDLVAQPLTLARTPSRLDHAAPEQGEHTDQVLHGLGIANEQIAELRRRQVI
jgi:crotonobetainyl-CoA:carnitine CoA-transferase CaiB-like acyl-CoA transferase